MFLDGGYFFGGNFYFEKVSVLLHYIIILFMFMKTQICIMTWV